MKKLTILIPKIKPPEQPDIITNQLKNIFNELKKQFELKLVWVIFQPYTFVQYEHENSIIFDYHKFNDAVDCINQIKPDLIITEVRLGINGITFAKAGHYCKIPVMTIAPTGKSEFFSQNYSAKSNFQLFLSDKVLADSSKHKNTKKFGMLRYSLHRYLFLIKTLKKINYSLLDLLKFFLLYPRIQIFSKSYPALNNLTHGSINLCFNKHWESRLIEANFPKNSISLCGDPAFDELYQKIQNQKIQNQKSKITKILFCPTPMHEHGWMTKKEEEKLIINLINYIQELPNVEISLKIHPSSSSISEYSELLKSQNIKIPLFQKENTIELLQKSDLMITYGSSNVILDSILLKKPVILIKNSKIPELNRLSDLSVITECNSISELKKIIDDCLTYPISNTAYENYIENQIGIFNGKNSKKICEILIKLVNI